jgi:hypothetical protein
MRQLKILVSAALITGAPLAAQGGASDLRAKLSARYAEMKLAMARKDEVAIRSLLTPDFLSVDVEGKSEDAALLVKQVLALTSDPSRQSQTTLISVAATGNLAVVEQRYDMKKTAIGADGSRKSVALTTVSSDTWSGENGVWRLARTATKQLDYSIDGITVVHKVNALPH